MSSIYGVACYLLQVYYVLRGEWRSRNDGMEGRHSGCKASTLLLSFNAFLLRSQGGLGYLFIYTLGSLICLAGAS